MRLITPFLFGLSLAASSAIAGETYSAGFSPSLGSGSRHIHLTLEVDKRDEGNFTGLLIINGTRNMPCGTHRKVGGKASPEGPFQFKTVEGEAEGCSIIQFSGRQEADSVTGNIRIFGQSHELTFKKN